MHTSKRMASFDKALLRMDTPRNLLVMTTALIFDKPLDIESVKRVLEHRLLPLDRFRQRVHLGIFGATWRADPLFDLDRHVAEMFLPPGSGASELQELISENTKQSLPLDKPLWHIDLIHNYEQGSVIVFRVHHCIAEGVAFMSLIVNLTDPEPGRAPLEKKKKEPHRSRSMPSKIIKFAASWAKESAILLFMPNDSRTRFKGITDIDKQVTWADPFSLSTAKVLAKDHGVTINDVMISVIAGALRKYLQLHNDQVDDRFVRAILPVYLRAKGQESMLGNEFGMVVLELSMSQEDPIQRLLAVNRAMSRIKGSAQAHLVRGMLRFGGWMPLFIQNFTFNLLSNRSSLLITNVPGPESALYLNGVKMNKLIGWVPQSGNVGISICILSYQGKLQLGLRVDKKLVPNVGEMMNMLRLSFDELCSQLNPLICAR